MTDTPLNPPNDSPAADVFLAGLQPCPFCGGGETQVREGRHAPTMRGPGALISVTVMHWCDRKARPGMLSGSHISFTGRDHQAAVDAWNRRAAMLQRHLAEPIVGSGHGG